MEIELVIKHLNKRVCRKWVEDRSVGQGKKGYGLQKEERKKGALLDLSVGLGENRGIVGFEAQNHQRCE